MRKVVSVFAVVLIAIIVSSCGDSSQVPKTENVKKSKHGGVLHQSETDEFQTLFPPNISDVISSNIATQVLEGLVRFNPKTLAVEPSIAENWELDSTGTIYTFHLKKGIYFHDNLCFKANKGREVKAADFKYCFEQLCTASPLNVNFQSTFKDRVVGANRYYAETLVGKPTTGLEGVKVINEYTLQIKLESPDNVFISLLANPFSFVYPKEAVDLYNDNLKVGTGPFVFEEGKTTKDKIVLSRNNNYHRKDSLGNSLPYLDSVIVHIIPDKEKELAAFKQGKLDFIIGLPTQTVSSVVQKDIQKFKGDSAEYVLDRMPEMVTQFYSFNLSKPPFDNIKVRKAFSYAINRKKIVDDVLMGEAYAPGDYGLCPPAFNEYDISRINGYTYDPDKARRLLAEAGYPGGKGFPKIKIELNSGGKKHTNVALEIQEQLLGTLGVAVEIEVVPLAQKIEDAKYGKAHIFRSGWVADYPAPESFLIVLYGGNVPDDMSNPSYPNTMRYKNPQFDKLHKEAKAAKTKAEAYDKYLQAEQIAMDDAPVIVLWYDENYRISRSYLKNFQNNPMRFKDYSSVYIQKN